MCGIVGEMGPAACSEQTLLDMMGMLVHRGPDEAGVLLAPGVSWGHLRLSVVDLESGAQPMSSHDGRYWIVFNGEIFNYLELRLHLEEKGHTFRTRSDTEVLINAYREWGVSCLERFNGQWAFALWDAHENLFFLARDRWGEKPLFYTVLPGGDTLAFASELKGLLADERVPRHWDYRALQDVFLCWAAESDRTPLEAVRQLPAGHCLLFRRGSLDIRRWWEVNFSPDLIEWNRSDQYWMECLRDTLQSACRLRLRADVPVGSYLSGGFDSSLISLLAFENHAAPTETFSVTFADVGFDESGYQHRMAQTLGADHHEIQIAAQSIATKLERVVWHAETPIYRTAPVPMFLLSSLVREHRCKVVLTGEGADELFAGYDQFKEDKIRRFWARVPSSAWRCRLLERLEPNIPGTDPRTRRFWYAFFQRDLERLERPGYSHRIRWYNNACLLGLLRKQIVNCLGAEPPSRPAASVTALADRWISGIESSVPTGFDHWEPLAKAQYWECRQLLSGYLLSTQGDRMSMANGVEARYPFLDTRIYELSRRMPPHTKLRGLKEKHLLKKAFARRLPSEIVSRSKHPFRAPEASCFLQPSARAILWDHLSTKHVEEQGIFEPEAVAKLLGRLVQSPVISARDSMALVLVLSTQIFHQRFVSGRMKPRALPSRCRYVEISGSPDTRHKSASGAAATY